MTAEERDALIVAEDGELLRRLEQRFVRSSGPGGQHRNKVETGVRLRLPGTQVEAQATERRSQSENRQRALGRMRRALALAVRGAADGPVPAAVADVLASRRWPRLSSKARDYWLVAARVLDRVAAEGARVSDAASGLGTSTGSLVKFLATDDALWQAVQQLRRQAGLGPLKR